MDGVRALATGEPVMDATVRRIDGGSPDAGIDQRANWIRRWNINNVTATTNQAGEFELDSFPLGGGQVLVGASGYSSEQVTINELGEPIEIFLEPRGSISGQVVSQDGVPVPAVIFTHSGSTRTDDGNFQFKVGSGLHRYRAVAKSGRSQTFEIETDVGESIEDLRIVIDIVGRVFGQISGLLEGESVHISADGASESFYTNGPYEVFGIRSGSHNILGRTSLGREINGTIRVEDSGEVLFDVNFSGGSSITGTVFIGNSVLSGTEVIISPEDASVPLGRTVTKSDGSYLFHSLPSGTYTVKIPARAFSKIVEIYGDMQVDFQLGIHTLFGRVQASSSVRGAKLQLTGGPPEQKLVTGIRTSVDHRGVFSFEGLPGGQYEIHATHPDFIAKSLRVKLVDESTEFDIFLEEKIE